MKILIVEDNEVKYKQITSVVSAREQTEVIWVKTLKRAHPQIRHGDFGLVILDMTFQVLEMPGRSYSIEALAGLQLLQYMKRIKRRIPVIVTTQHAKFEQPGYKTINGIRSLDLMLRGQFSDFYIGCVPFAENNGWEVQLIKMMEEVR